MPFHCKRSSRDITTVRVTYTRGGSKRELIVISAYLPCDSDEPPRSKGFREVVEYCSSNKLQLIGCDAFAHHIIWGSTDINPRGECLMEYLVSTNLGTLNKGNGHTFVISNRKEVTDLTLGTDKIGDLVTNYHIFDEISLSDHRNTVFQVGDLEVTRLTYCNPKRTNWESYREDLKVNLGVVPRVIHLVRDVELAVDMLQHAILLSYHQNCPARVAVSPSTVPWWNKELSHLKASTGRLFNQAKRTGDWESYKPALTC
jgi:hypothetical protein